MSEPYKNDKGLWDVNFRYVDYKGDHKRKHKCNFKTKRDAQEFMDSFLAKQSKNLNMSFKDFVDLYYEDMSHRLRENTMRSKKYIIDLKLIPYFGKRNICDISAADIRLWQNELLEQNYAQTYLKTINNQLTAIFNYAVRYYDLPRNPCMQAGSIGKSHAEEMNFWTKDEFERFLEAVEDKPISYYAFMTLFWTGLRVGELLALLFGDVDFENKTLSVTKSLQRIDGRDVVTEPKTEKGKRKITLPDFLLGHLQEYSDRKYGIMADERMFPVTKSYLEHEIVRGVGISGVKRIRLHDLRHSHASMLISQLDAPPLLVAQRLGHEKIQTTLQTYSHLYPNQAEELAEKLENLNKKLNNESDNWKGEDHAGDS